MSGRRRDLTMASWGQKHPVKAWVGAAIAACDIAI